MADTAQRSADAKITTNIIRSCEADDEQSFSFCPVSEKMDTARLVNSTARDHFGAFVACPSQTIYGSKESPTWHALSTDQNRSCLQQIATQMSGNCKHSKSFGRDHELAAFRASLLSSPDLYEVCPADDLFYKGQLLPLYARYRTQMFHGMVSLPFETERELLDTPPRSSADRFSSSFLPDSPKRIEVPQHRGARSHDIPQLEARIIPRLQQPALVHPDPFGSSSDDAAGETLSHRQSAFQNRRSTLKVDRAVWVSSENTSPTKDFKREGEDKSSTRSCFASPDQGYYQGGNDDRRSEKKAQRSSKATALAYWHKSIRKLFKPLDRLHSKDTDQRWDHASMSSPRTAWFNDCKDTGTAIANSVHQIKSDRSGQMQRRWRRNPDPFLRSSQSTPAAGIKFGVEADEPRWQNNMYKRAELHIGIEGAIAHCKQSQQARR